MSETLNDTGYREFLEIWTRPRTTRLELSMAEAAQQLLTRQPETIEPDQGGNDD